MVQPRSSRCDLLKSVCLSLVTLVNSGSTASSCPHAWERLSNVTECPYGWSFVQVTWPNPAKAEYYSKLYPNEIITDDEFLQPGWFTYYCAFYGYVPYAVMLFVFLEYIFRKRGSRQLGFLIFAALITLTNELVLKKFFKQARPERSCVSTCGMPSGHSCLACGYFTLLFLDVIKRATYAQDLKRVSRSDARKGKCVLWLWIREIIVCLGHEGITPLCGWFEISHREALIKIALWGSLLLPVPISRVAVRDHTPMQVTMGALEGVGLAMVWGIVVRLATRKYQHMLGCKFTLCRVLIFEHNYALPRDHMTRECRDSDREFDSALKGSAEEQKAAKKKVQKAYKALQWYMEEVREQYKEVLRKQEQQLSGQSRRDVEMGGGSNVGLHRTTALQDNAQPLLNGSAQENTGVAVPDASIDNSQALATEVKLTFNIENVDFGDITDTQKDQLSSDIRTTVASNAAVPEKNVQVILSARSAVSVAILVPDMMDAATLKDTVDRKQSTITAAAIAGLPTTVASSDVSEFSTSVEAKKLGIGSLMVKAQSKLISDDDIENALNDANPQQAMEQLIIKEVSKAKAAPRRSSTIVFDDPSGELRPLVAYSRDMAYLENLALLFSFLMNESRIGSAEFRLQQAEQTPGEAPDPRNRLMSKCVCWNLKISGADDRASSKYSNKLMYCFLCEIQNEEVVPHHPKKTFEHIRNKHPERDCLMTVEHFKGAIQTFENAENIVEVRSSTLRCREDAIRKETDDLRQEQRKHSANKTALDLLRREHDKKVQTFQHEKDNYDIELRTLAKCKEDLKELELSKKNDIRNLEDQLNTLRQDIAQKDKELDEKTATIEQLKKERQHSNSKNKSLEAECTRLKKSNTQKTTEYNTLQQQFTEREVENAKQKATIDTRDATIKTLTLDNESKELEKSTLQLNLTNKEQEVASLYKQVQGRDATIKERDARITAQGAREKELTDEVATLASAKAKLQGEKVLLDSQIDELTDKQEQLKKDNDDLHIQIGDQNEKIEQKKQSLEQLQQELNTLKDNNTELTRSSSDDKKKIDKLEVEERSLKENLKVEEEKRQLAETKFEEQSKELIELKLQNTQIEHEKNDCEQRMSTLQGEHDRIQKAFLGK